MPSSSQNGFADLGLAPKLVDILERLDYRTPTPIQAQAIPVVLKGEDVLGIAQTGTGKTFAFGLPVLQHLSEKGGSVLILAPTRELALQIQESLMKVGSLIQLRTTLLIGGAPMDRQIREIRNKPQVIIATPGRLVDHLEQRTISLSGITTLILDEADRMLDMGFQPQLAKIIQSVPAQRQTLLFSATMPSNILNLAKAAMRTPVHIEIARAGTTADTIQQDAYFVRKEQKLPLLHTILTNHKEGSVLAFSRTKHGAKKIAAALRGAGHSAVEIHANRTLAQRRAALEGFKTGRYRVLVATDIAARGIDVQGISLVINVDLPDALDDYVHRIGRTGRAGRKGQAISFILPEQKRDVMAIERLIKARITVSPLPTIIPLPEAAFTAIAATRILEDVMGKSGRGGRSGGRGDSRSEGAFAQPPRRSSVFAARTSFDMTRGGSGASHGSSSSSGRPAFGASRPSFGGYGASSAPRGGTGRPPARGGFGGARRTPRVTY